MTLAVRWTHTGAILAALILGAAASPDLPAGQVHSDDGPMWARQPGLWDIWASYPLAADRNHVAGRATVRCRVIEDGELTGCEIADESPAGSGFGSKALFLSKGFRIQVGWKGPSVRGQTVSASVDFTPRGFAQVESDAPAADGSKGPALVRWLNGPPESGAYPFDARFTGLSSRVVLSCKVGRRGYMSSCSAIEEWPKGFGFGRATERAGLRSRVASKTVDGRDTEGLTVDMIVITNPPCDYKPEADRRLDGCSGPVGPFRPDMNGRYF